jgi:hypothetical protein
MYRNRSREFSRILVSFRIRHPAHSCLRFGFVVGGGLLTESFSRCARLFR